MNLIIAFLLFNAALLFASPVFACAVCFVGQGGSSSTYLGTALILSVLPLGMIGGLVFWLYRRYKTNASVEPEQELFPNQHSSVTHSS